MQGVFKIAWALFGVFVYSKMFSWELLPVVSVFLGFYCALSVILSDQIKSKILKSFLAFFYVFLPGLSLGYLILDHAFFTPDMLDAVFQTSSSEAFEYCKQFLDWSILVYLFFIGFLFFIIKKMKTARTFPGRRKVIFILMALAAIRFAPETKLIYDSFLCYRRELYDYKEAIRARRIWNPPKAVTKAANDEIHVVVLGESLNRNHMSLYGYPRETTPQLDHQSDLLVFKDMISWHCYTEDVLTRALTLADVGHPLSYLRAPSIIELAKAAGFKTYWISNQQEFAIGGSFTSVLASSADERYFMNHGLRMGKEDLGFKTAFFDEKLVEIFDKILTKDRNISKPKILFIHLMGSHSLYKNRYPKEFCFFKYSEKDPIYAERNKTLKMDIMDQYDNSIRYTDYVVGELIRKISETGLPATLTFMSDHGEDPQRNRGHNIKWLSKRLVEIPFLIWVSPAYRKQNPTAIEILKTATQRPLENDTFDQFVFLLTRIETPGRQIQYQLSPANQGERPKRIVGKKYDYESLPD